MPEDTKKCPFCAETIKAEAVVCRFCGRDLPAPIAEEKQPEQLIPETPAKEKKRSNKRLILALIAGILLACCGLFMLPFIFSDSSDNESSSVSVTESDEDVSNDGEDMSEETASQSTQEPEPTNTSAPTDTPAPKLEIELVSVSDYLSDDTLVLYGEIFNSGDLPVREPDIRATLYDADGNILVTESSRADLPLTLSLWFTGVLYPGEKAPFTIFIDDPGEYADWKIDFNYDEASPRDYDEHCQDFLIQNDTGRPISDILYNFRVSGEIEHTGDKACGPVRFAVTLYDVEGNVVGVEIHMTDVDPFSPGEVYPFTIDMYARGTVDHYAILTRAIEK